VIIIDELDRCKPTYALGLLEKIKHLFSTKNVFFVLVMHKQELEKSIKCIYGDIDAYAYLQKFIHVQTTLPKKTDGNNNDLEKYAQHLFKSHNFETWGHSQDLLGYVEQLAVHFQLSLRQLEKVFTNLAIFYAAVVEKSFQDPTIVSFLAVMKVIDPSICQSLLFRKISYSQLCDKTGIVKSRELSDWLVDRIHYFTCSKEEYTQLEVDNRVKQMEHIQYMNNNKGYICNLDRLDIMPMLIRRMSLFTA
jgi:hypothetical protein